MIALVLFGAAAPVVALSTDRDKPITIEADQAEADDARRVTVYRGAVVIDQGTLHITGETVTIYYDEKGELAKMVSVGDPARFRQLPDGETEYRRARADRMEYYAKKDLIVLLGNAQYGQGEDRMTADRIVYDSRRSRVKADTAVASGGASGGDQKKKRSRVHIKIAPRKKTQ